MIILGILGVFLTFETFLWDDDGNGHIWTYLFLFITRRPIFGFGQEVELLAVLSPPSATPHPASMDHVHRTGIEKLSQVLSG